MFVSHDAQLFGATRSLVDLIEGLNATGGFTCHIVLPTQGPIEEILNKKQITYDIIKFYPVVSTENWGNSAWTRFKGNIKTYSLFKAVKQKFKPDFVYFNTGTAYFPVFFFYLWGVKSIIHLREYGFEDYRLVHDWNGKLLKSGTRLAHLTLTNSQALAKYYKEKYNVSSKVLYNGVFSEQDFIEKKNLKKASALSPTINIGVVGIMNENKGQELVLDTFIEVSKTNPDLYLQFYGSGEIQQKLQDKSIAAGIQDKVLFKGFVPNTDDIYPHLDILIVSSKNEAFGRVSVEAMAYGVPVIGLANGGTIELLDQDRGLLFDGSKENLKHKLIELTKSEKLRDEISAKAWEYSKTNLTRQVYVQKFISYLNTNQ